jgi:hypothetical protein
MMGWLSSSSEGARGERMNNASGRAFIRTPLASDEVLDVQLQVALAAEDLGPRNSLRELRRIIVRVQDVLDVADVCLTLLEPHGWQLLAVRFDDEVAVILRRHATAAQVVAELDDLPGNIRNAIGRALRLCATVDGHVLELELASDGLRPLETDLIHAVKSAG